MRRILLKSLRGNGSRYGRNGEIVTVSNIDNHNRIHLQGGRILPKDFRQFAYGYAVTAHRSQGKTVDAVIISGDNMRKELFYVAASRGRENLAVITSDKERLQETIGRSTARQSASELTRKLRPGLHQNISRGMEAARRLAEWIARQFRTIYRHESEKKHEPATRPAPIIRQKPAMKPEPIIRKDFEYER